MQYILVIDDDPDIRELIVQTLTDEGYTALDYNEGEKAIAAMLINRPSLVLLDLMMPTLSGWEVAQRIRAEATIATVPIVIISASRELETAFQQLDVNASLAKPFDLDELIRTVQVFITKPAA